MSKLRNGFLSILGAILSTIILRFSFGFLDVLLTELIESRVIDEILSAGIASSGIVSVCTFMFLSCAALYGTSASIAGRFVRMYCRKLPMVNEYGIRVWLIFSTVVSCLGLFTDGTTVQAVCAAAGALIPTYAFLRYVPREETVFPSKPEQPEPDQSEPEPPEEPITKESSLPATLRRSTNLRK